MAYHFLPGHLDDLLVTAVPAAVYWLCWLGFTWGGWIKDFWQCRTPYQRWGSALLVASLFYVGVHLVVGWLR